MDIQAPSSVPEPRHGKSVQTWASTFLCMPRDFFEPSTLEEIQAIVRMAHHSGRHIRVCGGLHSPNDCAMSEDVLVSLRNFNQVRAVDRARRMIMVEAGITLSEIHEVLDFHGLAMENLGSISEQSIAGAISTGTHGTGLLHGIMATQVRELQLVLASGEVVLASRQHNPDLFQAALCGLGAVGIITGVILRVTNAFDLHEVGRAVPLKDLLPEYMARARSHHFYRFWWFPHTDMCWEVTATPLKPAAVTGGRSSRGTCSNIACWSPWAFTERWLNWIRFTLFGFYLFQVALFVGVLIPAIVPYVNRVWRYVLFHVRREKIDRSDKVMNIDCLFKQHVDEWAVPIRQLPEAMNKLQDLIARNGFRVHFPVEVRFVRGDDIWLSPAYGGDAAFIGIIMYKPFGATMEYRDYFDEYERAMARLGGRPHWAKCFRLTEPDFGVLYPKWSLFKEVREDVDPDGVFVNQWVERVVLGDGSGPSGYLEDGDPGSAASGGGL